MCINVSASVLSSCVCVCDGESRDHIQYSDRGFLFSLPSVSHTGRDCERRPAALASCTCKHDIRNEREREVSQGKEEKRKFGFVPAVELKTINVHHRPILYAGTVPNLSSLVWRSKASHSSRFPDWTCQQRKEFSLP